MRISSRARVGKIISGGQSGADRAALDFAIAHGIDHGGWCPCGRWAEDGTIAAHYLLMETPSTDPAERTEWNVRDSDGTVIFSLGHELAGGSKLTMEFALMYRKPWLHLSGALDLVACEKNLSQFILKHRIKNLNVAGHRASEEPEVGGFVWKVCAAAFAVCPDGGLSL